MIKHFRNPLTTTIRVIALSLFFIVGSNEAFADKLDENETYTFADEEAIPDFETFKKAGYQMVNWGFDESKKKSIYQNILLPDFVKRTNKEEPKFPSFDYALENLTGGNFNDVIVWSRLPGDCNINGCMVAVFHLVGDKWEVVSRFQAIGVMHRYASNRDRTSELVAVGDALNPSTIFRWNGKSFTEAK